MPPVIIAAVISSAAGVYAAHEAASGNKKAAETSANASDESARIQAETADKALAQAKEIYQQQRADQGPYRESGYGAMNALNYGLGLPAVSYQAPASATPTPTNLPQSTINGLTFPGSPQIPGSTLNTLGQAAAQGGPAGKVLGKVQSNLQNAQQLANAKFAGQGGTTRVQAPNGLVYLVPNDKVPDAQKAGGTVI